MVLLVIDAQTAIVDARLYAFEKFVLSVKKLINGQNIKEFYFLCFIG